MAKTSSFSISLQGKIKLNDIKTQLKNLKDKCSLQIKGKLNLGDIKTQISNLKDKYYLRIRVALDKTSLRAVESKLKKLNTNILAATADTAKQSKSASTTSGTAVSKTVDELLPGYKVDKISYEKDAENNALKQRLNLINGLDNQATLYYKKSESGEMKLDKITKTVNVGEKQRLQLMQQNELLSQKISGNIAAYGSQAKISQKEVADFNAKLADINKLDDEIAKNKGLKQLNTDVKTASESVGILGQSFTKAMTKYVTWLGIATIVARIMRALKSMIGVVIQLDTALVELKKVTDLSAQSLEKVKKEAFEIANTLGTTGTNFISAMTEFARAGYELADSKNLAKVAVTLTNVAENITDAGDAANYIISILKGANLEVSEASRLLDELNEVSNRFAVDLGSLADMVQRIAGTMTTFGNSIEQTMALVTGAYEVLQDERVARGISTISARIAGLNEDMEKEEGLANDVSEALMKYARIDVFDNMGQLRDTYDILEELAGKWDKLSKNAQSVLLNTVAGKTRMDVLSAILTNWESVSKSLEATSEAEGSAAREQAAFLDSIEGRVSKLSNAWQQLADTTINTDIVKNIVDLGTAILNAANRMGGLLNVAMLIGGAFGTWKLVTLIRGIKQGTIAINGLTTATKAAATQISILKAAMIGVSAIMFAISAVSTIISEISAANERAEQARQERIEAIAEDVTSLKTLRSTYYELLEQTESAEELNEKLADSYEKLTNMAKKYGVSLTDVNGNLKDYITLLNDVNVEAKKRELQTTAIDYSSAKKYLSSSAGLGSIDPLSDSYTFDYVRNVNKIAAGTLKSAKPEELANYYRKALDELGSKGIENLSKEEKQHYTKIDKELGELENRIKDAVDTVSKYEQTQFEVAFAEADQAAMDSLTKSFADWSAQTNEQMTLSSDAMLSLIDTFVEEMKNKYPDFAEAIEAMVGDMRKKVISAQQTDILLDALDKKTAALERQKKLDEEEYKLQQKLLKVEKARAALADAQNKKLRVFKEGVGFVYDSDVEAIQKAQEDLESALHDAELTDVDVALANIEKITDAYNNGLAKDAETGTDVIRAYFRDATNYAEFFAATFSEKMRILADLGAEPTPPKERESTEGYLGVATSAIQAQALLESMGESALYQQAARAIANSTATGFTGTGADTYTISIGTVTLDNVTNAEDFVEQLKTLANYQTVNFSK